LSKGLLKTDISRIRSRHGVGKLEEAMTTHPLPPAIAELIAEWREKHTYNKSVVLTEYGEARDEMLVDHIKELEALAPVWESAVREQVEAAEEAAYKEGWDHGWVGAGLPEGAPGSEPLSGKRALVRHDQEREEQITALAKEHMFSGDYSRFQSALLETRKQPGETK
jgi:hypothetical protein